MNGKREFVGTGMIAIDELILGSAPWTKPEVRAVTIAKMDLLPHHRVLDLGAGTGTVTLEIAQRVCKGHVVSIEMKEKACQLIEANLKKFELENVELIQGKAPDCLPEEEWDRIFIGGTGGNLTEILQYAMTHLREDGILVMNTVTIDTLSKAQSFFKERELDHEVILLQVSRIKEIGGYSMYQGENPIHLITFKNCKGEK